MNLSLSVHKISDSMGLSRELFSVLVTDDLNSQICLPIHFFLTFQSVPGQK